MPRASFSINGAEVKAGSRTTVSLSLPSESNLMDLAMPVHVVHGRRDGPVVFISAAIHGDEINGIEIIRRILKWPAISRLKGTLIAIPIVNVYGFLTHSRYLPDRRDLNRSFPGSQHGSLAARLAYTFREEIVKRADYGIDLHTGAAHRTNHPHIRANLDDEETERLALAFGTPVIINANLRDGSLRQYAADQGVPMLLYEAGEALRFNELAINAGVKGVRNVLRALGMVAKTRSSKRAKSPAVEARSSAWVRSPKSGVLMLNAGLGARVEKNEILGVIADVIDDEGTPILSPQTGIVIGRTNLPIINEGDALIHIACFADSTKVESAIEAFHEEHIEGLGPEDYPKGTE